MTFDDLINYQVSVRVPYEETYRGYLIRSVPSPSSGGLTLLEDAQDDRAVSHRRCEAGLRFRLDLKTLHVMAEALRIGFADRGRLDG